MLGIKEKLSGLADRFFSSGEGKKVIGVYGPPNSGKSTFTNQLARDWEGEEISTESQVPHETREIEKRDDVTIETEHGDVTIDICDTPGIESKVDYENFMDEHNMDEDSSKRRAKEGTEGIAKAMSWLREDMDGVIYIVDSTKEPTREVNSMVTGIIESEDIPAVVLANKIDKDDSDVERVREVFDDKKVIPTSALENDNLDEVYDKIVKKFG